MGHFLHQAAKTITSPLKILPTPLRDIAAPVLGGLAFGPAGLGLVGAATGAAVAGGVNKYAETGKLGPSLLSGGLSYVGSNLGESLFPGAGNVGSALKNTLGPSIGSSVANAVGSTVANTSLGSILGGYIGSNVADAISPQKSSNPTGQNASTPFQPTQQSQASLPVSLQGLGGLTPMQQASNIATGGVYGGGQGPDEQSYFTNLVNRQLVDQTGKTSDISTLNPIEQSYLKQLGLGGYGNSTDLLQAISKFKPS